MTSSATNGPAACPFDERFVADERRAVAPLHLELARGAHGRPFVGGDDADEIGDAHDAHAGQVRDRCLVDRQHPRTDRGRPHDAAVQHAGHDEVMHIDMAPGHLGGHVRPRQRLADQHVVGRSLERRLGIHLDVEAAAADQRRDFNAAAAGRAHCAVGQPQVPRPATASAATPWRAALRVPSPRPAEAPRRRA